MNVIQGQSRCEKVQGLMDAYLSNELLVETTQDILTHLQGCAQCTGELEARTRVRNALRRAVMSQEAPETLRSRVVGNVRQAARDGAVGPGVAFGSWGWMAGAVAALALMAGITWRIASRDFDLTAALLNVGWTNHLKCTLAGHYAKTPLPIETSLGYLGPEYAPLLPVVREKLPEFELLQAHRCTIAGRKFTHFILHRGDTVVSVSLVEKRTGEDFPQHAWNQVMKQVTPLIYEEGISGIQIAGFESAQHLAFVMSNTDKAENSRMAYMLAPEIRRLVR